MFGIELKYQSLTTRVVSEYTCMNLDNRIFIYSIDKTIKHIRVNDIYIHIQNADVIWHKWRMPNAAISCIDAIRGEIVINGKTFKCFNK